MTHGGDDRKRGRGDFPRHGLVVKRLEILLGAPSPRHDDKVELLHPVKPVQRPDYLGGGGLSLDARRRNYHLDIGRAPVDDLYHVPHRRARGRSHDPYSSGKKRKGAFSRRVEKSFLEKFLLELLERERLRAHPFGVHGLDVELVGAPLLVDAHPAAAYHLRPVFRVEPYALVRRPEAYGGYLAFLVLEGEIPVAARVMSPETGNLSGDQHGNSPELKVDRPFYRGVEFRNSVDFLAHIVLPSLTRKAPAPFPSPSPESSAKPSRFRKRRR